MSRRIAPITPWQRSSAATVSFAAASLVLEDGVLYPSSTPTDIKFRVSGDVLAPSDDTAAAAARIIIAGSAGVVI